MSTTDRPRQLPAAFRGDDYKTWAWLLHQFKVSGQTLADVARAEGVRRQTLYRARTNRYPRMEGIIARALQMAPHQVWPHRYTSDGLPIGVVNLRKPRSKKKAQQKTASKCTQDSKARVSQSRAASNVNPPVAG